MVTILPRDQNVVSAAGRLTSEEVATFDTTEVVNGRLTVTTRTAPDVDRTYVSGGTLSSIQGVGGTVTYRTIVGSGSPSSNTLNDTGAATWFGQIGGTNAIVTSANPKSLSEAAVARKWLACVLKEGAMLVTQQTRTAQSVWKTRKNGADGNISVVNPGGAISTGSSAVFTDPTNIDVIADGDLVNNALSFDADPGFMVSPHIGYTLETSTQSDVYFSGYNATAVNYSTSALRMVGMTGLLSLATVELGASMPVAGTLDRLQTHLTVAGTAPKAFSSRKNGVIGNSSVPMTSAALLEDPTNVDAFVAGDLLQFQVLGAGTTPSIDGVGCRIKSSTKNVAPVVSHGTAPIGGNGSASYWSGFNQLRRNNVEGESRNAIPHAGVLSRTGINVAANANADDVAVTVRRAAADLNGSVIIPAGQTGVFTDPTNVDAFVAEEAVTHKAGANQAVGTTFAALSYQYEVAA